MNSIIEKLDAIADKLENKGLTKEAAQLDIVSNTLEQQDTINLLERLDYATASRAISKAIEPIEKILNSYKAPSNLAGILKTPDIVSIRELETDPSTHEALIKDVTDYITKHFPQSIEFRRGGYSLLSLLLTEPVMSYLLENFVFNKNMHMPKRGRPGWVAQATKWLVHEAYKIPEIRTLINELKQKIQEHEEEYQRRLKQKKPTEEDFLEKRKQEEVERRRKRRRQSPYTRPTE